MGLLISFNLCMTTLSVLSLLIAFLSRTRTEAAATYLYHVCPNTTTFTANSTYRSNLIDLLGYLSSNATSNPEFYNASAGNSGDTVYGLFLCRGDLPAEACRDCVAGATEDVPNRCPEEKMAVAWYEECMLRYSNRYIFSTMVPDPTAYFWSRQNVLDANRFDELVMATMNDLATGISNVGSGAKKFGTKEAKFTVSQTLYTLVQCTPDLSGYDCNRCLQIAMTNLPGCCSGKTMARVLFPSCYLWYDVYPFYLTVNTSAPTPNPALVPPPPSPGKGELPLLAIIAIIAAISVCAMLFIMGYCFLRRARKKYNAIQEAANGITSTVESLQFNFATIEAATNNFSNDNKLGEGGFGAVYKVNY